MIRLFEQHQIRKIKELDGIWDFSPEGDLAMYQLPVPGCWEQHPNFSTYRGKGTYRKTIVITPFSTIIKQVQKGTHEIKVLVDNGFGEYSALHIPNDYYTYGGITRPVSLACISDTYIKQIKFTPSFEDGVWYGKLDVVIHNTTSKLGRFSFVSTIDHYEMSFNDVEVLGDSETTVTIKQQFPDITPWSHKNPKLYSIHTILSSNGNAIDDLIERVGFRTVNVIGTKLQVNGEHVFLKGFNRHEDYATVGCAIPLPLMVHDMDLMQDMGVNALRTCHYPNDEIFLDLCDERGILVWEENHARGLLLEDMQNPNFDKQCEDCNREMVENHYNHPCVIIWGILNECASETKEGRLKYQKQYEQIKNMDTSRPTTSATCRHFTDISLDLPDIVSFNMYSGWYKDVPVKERNEEEIEWIKNSGGDDKPIIVSELGAAAIYGYRDRTRCKWSEERQADIIEENLKVYMNDEHITGVFVWQFADCRVTEEGPWFATRARCHNNKGVVDEYRRPKIAYDIVKNLFLDKK